MKMFNKIHFSQKRIFIKKVYKLAFKGKAKMRFHRIIGKFSLFSLCIQSWRKTNFQTKAKLTCLIFNLGRLTLCYFGELAIFTLIFFVLFKLY